MPFLMGPVLSFRGCEDGHWTLTAVVVSKGDPGPLTTGGVSVVPVALWQQPKGTAYRYTFSCSLGAAPTTMSYTVGGDSYDVAVPALGQSPRIAYVSCNGFSSLKLMKTVKDANYLWKVMARKHGLPPLRNNPTPDDFAQLGAAAPYHLLLQGGDQVYANSMWEKLDPMQAWLAKSWDDGNAAKAPKAMRDKLDAFYFELYTSR